MVKNTREEFLHGQKVKFSIALKLILATSAVVVLISLGFVIFGIFSTQTQYRHFAQGLKESEMAALVARGRTTSQNLSDSMYPPLLDGSIDRVLDTVKSVASGDKEIVEALVIRRGGRIVAHSKDEKLGENLDQERVARLEALKGVSQLTEIGSVLPSAIAFGSPIQLSTQQDSRILGYLYIQLSTQRIAEAMEKIDAEREEAVRSALVKTASLGIGALVIGVLIAVYQGLRFGRAIGHLTHVATEVGKGNLQARAVPSTQDEIGVLCTQFNDMTSRVEVLLKESVEKAALDQELERANAIQNLLMPSRDEFNAAGLTYCGMCEPATQMGGDWWHHYPLNEDRVLLCIGDVTGHGIPSAMLTATTKACCDTLLYQQHDVDLAQFMRLLDHAIRESGKGELVMTFFAALIDSRAMTMKFVNAGHNFPLLFRGKDIQSLVARGRRLGDGSECTVVEKTIEKDDLLVFYTDGILECENEAHEQYGMRRFRRLLQSNKNEPVTNLRKILVDDAYAFYGTMPREDDITLALCRLN